MRGSVASLGKSGGGGGPPRGDTQMKRKVDKRGLRGKKDPGWHPSEVKKSDPKVTVMSKNKNKKGRQFCEEKNWGDSVELTDGDE